MRIVKLYRSLPNTPDAQVMGKQLLRCGTSVGANYRAACRSRSRAEFVSRLSIVVEEADEAGYWLELLVETGIVSKNRLADLRKQADELTALFNAARQTTKNG